MTLESGLHHVRGLVQFPFDREDVSSCPRYGPDIDETDMSPWL